SPLLAYPSTLSLHRRSSDLLGYKLSNGSLNGLRAVKPVTSSSLAHAQHFNQSIYHIILEECESIPGFYPWGTVLFFKYSAELFRDRKSTRLNSSHVSISYAV